MEEVLSTHPSVSEVSVFGVNDTFWGEAVTAAIVLRSNMTATAEELLAFCDGYLAGYKKPKKIYFLNELPKYLYGKVLRKVLKARFEKSNTF